MADAGRDECAAAELENRKLPRRQEASTCVPFVLEFCALVSGSMYKKIKQKRISSYDLLVNLQSEAAERYRRAAAARGNLLYMFSNHSLPVEGIMKERRPLDWHSQSGWGCRGADGGVGGRLGVGAPPPAVAAAPGSAAAAGANVLTTAPLTSNQRSHLDGR